MRAMHAVAARPDGVTRGGVGFAVGAKVARRGKRNGNGAEIAEDLARGPPSLVFLRRLPPVAPMRG